MTDVLAGDAVLPVAVLHRNHEGGLLRGHLRLMA